MTSAPDSVAAKLRTELLDGVIPHGSRLHEEQLCERFGVGRHTVRSALQQLAAAGLIVHERNRGARVRELTSDWVDEMFTYRLVIELGSLRVALTRGVDLTPVVQAVDALAAEPPDANWGRLMEVHSRIHDEIVAAAGNPRLLRAHRACADELRLMLTAVAPLISRDQLIALHRDLADGLRTGGEAALRALTADIEHAGRAALLEVLRQR
ncbi:GntR family transcriptional regulator [Phytoactinopolyspora limicola]|uniref:GntR family transcriptional regulator n=1 Tax=Phytoactinopolyspora limicola TaxID=2715536 RepID=UPI00140BA327|nr:GntR family transcriptional regulator [Phytoactinopolyspora limicola]